MLTYDIRIIDFCVRSKKYNFKNNSLILCIFNFTPILILLNFKILRAYYIRVVLYVLSGKIRACVIRTKYEVSYQLIMLGTEK